MDEEKLKKKGWSQAEVDHAKLTQGSLHPEALFAKHVRLWTLLAISLSGAVGACIAVFPVIIFMQEWFCIAFFTLVGGCLGLLMTAALHTLDIHQKHHHHAMSVFLVLCIIAITLIIALLEKRFGGMINPLLVAIAFTIGVVIPYQSSRRMHGSS